MNMCEVEKGKSYKVTDAQLEAALKVRLGALGLTDGTIINILNRKGNGSVIFNVRGTRLAIGKKIAEKINLEAVQK